MSHHQQEIDENSEPEDLADYMKQKMGGLAEKGVGEELLRGGLRVGEQMSEPYLEGRASMRGGEDAGGMSRQDMEGFGSRDNRSKGRCGDETQRGRPEPGHRGDKAKEGRGLAQVDYRRHEMQGDRSPLPNNASSGHRSEVHGGHHQMRADDRQQGSGSENIRGGQEGLDGRQGTQDYNQSREHDQHGSRVRGNRGEEERNRMPRDTKRYPGMDHKDPERQGGWRETEEQHSGISSSKGPKVGEKGERTSSKDEESVSGEESSDEESDRSSEGSSDDDSGSEEDSEGDSSEEESEEDSASEEDESGEESDEESEEDSDDDEED